MKENDENWKVLNYYENAIEANIVKGVLETNGIPCVITNELMSSVLPLSFTPAMPIKILIPKDKFSEAQQLLNSTDGDIK